MRRRWLYLSLLLLVAILLLGSFTIVWTGYDKGPKKPQPIPTGDYTYAKELAEHRIEQVMNQHHIPGAAVALVVDQEIIWQKSFGLANIDQEIPVTEDTVFKLWSLSKAFTAVEIMRLVEEGLVDLDAPIDKYIPEFAIHSRFPDGEAITIRHILAHRSGLPRNGCYHETNWHMGSDAVERFAGYLKDCFLTYPTGSRYKYSNVGYDALGYIIQDKKGQIFPPYMQENLLAPADMLDSAFWSTDLKLNEDQLALGYEFYEGEHYAYEQYDIASIPSGNLYGTVGDLANFIRFIFRDGQANGQQIIGPETLDRMFEDQYSHPADPQHMGLGWKIGQVIESEKMVWHDGGPSEGIGSLVAMLPERKMGVVLLANSTTFDGSQSVPLAMELLEAMLETEYGLVAIEEEPYEIYPVETAVLEDFVGDYAAFGRIMEVYLDGDHLKGSIDGISFDLVPVAENRFRVTHWLYKLGLADFLSLPMDLRELEIEFQVGADAGQDIMIINLGGITYEMCPRYPDLLENMAAWEALAGEYERYYRLPSGNAGWERLGESEITIVDGRLHMADPIGPLLPIDENTIIILSGSFAGETISYDPGTGNLYHQGFVYKPALNEG